MPCPSRTRRSGTTGCLTTSRFITDSGSTRPFAGAYLCSGSPSCSADEPGKTQHLGSNVMQEKINKISVVSRPSMNAEWRLATRELLTCSRVHLPGKAKGLFNRGNSKV